MKKLTKLGLLAVMMLVVVMLLTGCANKQEEKDNLEGLAVYTAEETPDYKTFDQIEGIEFKYPSNYTSVGEESLPIFIDPDVPGATIKIGRAHV